MSILHAAILGIVQGLGEFLPISSSGHLNLVQRLLGMGLADNGNAPVLTLLTVLLHVGTLIAVIVVFWEDWIGIFKDKIVKSKLLGLLILASLPAVALKVALKVLGLEESDGFLGLAFLLTGCFLLLAEKLSHRGRHAQGETDVKPRNALIMGCMQALAMMPGVSRSGSTILGGVGSGLSKKTAIRFSFMMSAPAILGGLLLEAKDAAETGAFSFVKANIVPIAVGVVLAALVGYAAIQFMLRLVEKVSLNWFALYVIVLGAVVLILQCTGVLPAITGPYISAV
ncbi:MAG: undecaprenyl-diphosphate phosphatase [Clostridia bacterium]|nr:undecaprenyl-diphosphate phosphatase [Clostridia bacterium]